MKPSSVEVALLQILGLAIAGLCLVPSLAGPEAMPGPRALWFVALPLVALAVAARHRFTHPSGSEVKAGTSHRRRPGERRAAATRAVPLRKGRRLRAA